MLSGRTRVALFLLVAVLMAPICAWAEEAAANAGASAGVGLGYVRLTWLVFMLLMGTGWLAACFWVNQDATGVGESVERWNLIFILTGAVLFLGSFVSNPNLVLVLAAALAVEMGLYIWFRNQRVPANFRLLTPHHFKEIFGNLTQKAGIDLQRKDDTPAVSRDTSSIVLMRKDGTSADALAKDKRHAEGSEAILMSKHIIENAVKARATDIHFEPKGNELQVRFRVDGILHSQSPYNSDLGRAIVSSLKVIANMDIAERRRPQDGTFSATLHDSKFDIRAATGPSNFGETMVLRLLDSGGGVIRDGLTGLGLNAVSLKHLRSVVHSPHGMLIASGPTGSGKTTTLYASLSEIDAFQRNIITIEDPIEYQLDNVTQIPVNPTADLTFASILRSVLRQDPDVIMVGEMRDLETAQIGLQAALTGHFVFTTLHANDSVSSITRLLDIGVEPTLIQSAVSAVLAQRLIRVLCAECREAYTPKPQFLQKLRIPPDKVQRLYKEKGCEECQGTGYRGRTGIYELLVLTDELRDLITAQPSMQAIKRMAREQGLKSLQEDGLQRVIKGATSITEVIRVSK